MKTGALALLLQDHFGHQSLHAGNVDLHGIFNSCVTLKYCFVDLVLPN